MSAQVPFDVALRRIPAIEDGYAWVQRVTLTVDGIPFALRGYRSGAQFLILPGQVWRKRRSPRLT